MIISGSVGDGVFLIKGFFIQYKFILPKTTKHSAYSYQKLFRALYGYTQNVTKSNGKTHRYSRQGILSNTPYLRPGKNCVIIPKEHITPLTDFFKTGKNPAHFWHTKGDWKAVYYMEEKNLSEEQVKIALEELLERKNGLSKELNSNLFEEIINATESNGKKDKTYLNVLFNESKKITSMPWFREVYKNSKKLTEFYSYSNKLKELI